MGMISFNGVNYPNNGSKVQNISEEDYQALVQAGTVNPNTIYFRYNANTLFPPIQDDGSATDLTNGSLPTGQTIESYLNTNFVFESYPVNITIPANDKKELEITNTIAKTGYLAKVIWAECISSVVMFQIEASNNKRYLLGRNFSSSQQATQATVNVMYVKWP